MNEILAAQLFFAKFLLVYFAPTTGFETTV